MCRHDPSEGRPTSDPVIREQIDYYRARAPEYDEWWQQEARYDFGRHVRVEWEADIAQLEAWLGYFDLSGEVLELAAGTGNWTTFLAARARRVLALDSSPESLDINAAKLSTGNVEFEVTDIFEWVPKERFGVVFFGFWLSHVPLERFAHFWAMVEGALAPGGSVLVIDNAHPEYRRRHGPTIAGEPAGGAPADGAEDGRSFRRLADGRTFTIVKNHWTPAMLTAALADLGWAASAGNTSWAFLHASVRRA